MKYNFLKNHFDSKYNIFTNTITLISKKKTIIDIQEKLWPNRLELIFILPYRVIIIAKYSIMFNNINRLTI